MPTATSSFGSSARRNIHTGAPLIAAMPCGTKSFGRAYIFAISMTTSGCYQRRAADTCSERCVSSVIRVRRTSEHSEKPKEVYQIIECKYPQFNKARLLELFQRRPVQGFARFGATRCGIIRVHKLIRAAFARSGLLQRARRTYQHTNALKRCACDLSLRHTSFNSAASHRNELCTSM